MRAGFDAVKEYSTDVDVEVGIQFTNAGRAGDVDLGEIVANHVDAGKYQTHFCAN